MANTETEKTSGAGTADGRKKKSRLGTVLVLLLALAVAAGIWYWYGEEHQEDWLTRDEALHIALKDAGAKENLVYDVTVKLNDQNETIVYDISFTNHKAQFFYTVDARTGEITGKRRVDS